MLVEVSKRISGLSKDGGGEIPREPERTAAVALEQLVERLGGVVEVIRPGGDERGSVCRRIECCGSEAHRVEVDDGEALRPYEDLTGGEVPVRQNETVDRWNGRLEPAQQRLQPT